MPRKLNEFVVVITGAASGIGRATAHEFAQKGARVVVAARNNDALRDVVDECEAFGTQALGVPTDVTNDQAVDALANAAIERFGRIDVWVNAAAVALYSRFEEAPLADYRRVLDTNIMGYVHGARAALRAFRKQGSGVLINISSVESPVPQPYASAYVMSKAANRVLSTSLRQELMLEGAKNIHVCAVLPAAIDTPFFQHAANYTGRTIKPPPPVYTAQQVAQTIVRVAQHPKREVSTGSGSVMFRLLSSVAPSLTENIMAREVERLNLDPNTAAPATSGNLWEPMRQHNAVDGGWQGVSDKQRGLALVGLALAAVPAALLWRRRRRA